MVDRRSLLFRLHNSKTRATFYHAERNFFLASRYAPEHKDRCKELLDPPSLEESVERHVTSWARKDRDPSGFISLTCNVLWAFWEWKRQVTKPDHPADPEGFRDVFDIVVLKSSELCVSARLGTEILSRGKCRMAYDFADSAGEVIVAKYIHKEAILGITRISELLEFLPSWCRKQLEKVTWSSNEAPRIETEDIQVKERFVQSIFT